MILFLPQKSNKPTYFLHTNSMVKKFKHRFYIKELLISICKANEEYASRWIQI